MRRLIPALVLIPLIASADSLWLREEGTRVGRIEEINCSGAGVSCAKTGQVGTLTISGGGGGKTMIMGKLVSATTLTIWFAPMGSVNHQSASTGNGHFQIVPLNGTVRNLYVAMDPAQGAGDTCQIDIMKSADCLSESASVGVTCTIQDVDSACSDTSNTGTFTAGECIQMKFTEVAGSCSGFLTWAFEYAY